MTLIENGGAALSAVELEAVRKLIANTTDEERLASGLSAREVELCGNIYDKLTPGA